MRPFRTLLVLALGAQAATGLEVRDPREVLRAGRYDDAIAAYKRDARTKPADAEVHRGLASALIEVGRYDEAEEASRAFMAANARSAEMWSTLGQVLLLRGKLDAAQQAFAKAISGRAKDALSAEVALGELRLARGDREQARRSFERLIAAYNAGAVSSAADLIAVGKACRALGQENPQTFKDALKAFDEAADADPGEPEAKLLTGELFLEKYNGSEARSSFEQVLALNPAHPRALIGLARARDFDGEMGVPDLVKRALQANPNLALAHAYQAGLLTALEDYPGAAREAELALETNPASEEALAALAAVKYLQGDKEGFAATEARADKLYPGSGELLVTVADACVRNRFYTEAADFAKQAIARDQRSWQAYALAGQNQLRLGRIEEGRKSLERSFEGDPYNVWVKNTLDLLDTFPAYKLTASEHFRFFASAQESELLTPYLSTLAEEALAKLEARYQVHVATPIRVELYPSHADFSVRTVGLAGVGALGVCFGPVVALDSPQARERGKFNWGSTLWHELAHTITMAATDNRIPRWLTEGLSVYEERRARRGWGDDLSLEFLIAMKAGKLLPLRDLNNGFVRPTSPEQVGLSYYQASLVVEHLEATRGLPALLLLLKGYKEGKSTDVALQAAVGKSVDEFDKEFQAALQEHVKGPLATIRVPGKTPPTRAQLEQRAREDAQDFIAQAMLGRLLYGEKRHDDALPFLERAKALWPESAGDESPLLPLAIIKRDRGDLRGAAEELRALADRNEGHEQANLELATLLERLGDTQGAAAALERVVYIYPLDAKLFERQAALAAKRADAAALVRARRALLALGPVDKAEAYYALAEAELLAGDAASAKRHVVLSLEAAPRFARAQELLLKIHRGEAK